MPIANILLSLALLVALPLAAQKSSPFRSKASNILSSNSAREIAGLKSPICKKLDKLLQSPDTDLLGTSDAKEGFKCDYAYAVVQSELSDIRKSGNVPDDKIIELNMLGLVTCYAKFSHPLRSVLCEQLTDCERRPFEIAKYICYLNTAFDLEKTNREYQALGKAVPKPTASPTKQ